MSVSHIVITKIREAERSLRGCRLDAMQYQVALDELTRLGESLRIAAEAYQPGSVFGSGVAAKQPGLDLVGPSPHVCGRCRLAKHNECVTATCRCRATSIAPHPVLSPGIAELVDAAVDGPPKPNLVDTFRDPRVDHPSYYGGEDNVYEAIKVIDAWGLGFCLGNAVKYISRAGKKSGTTMREDLKKAAWYVNHEIEQLG